MQTLFLRLLAEDDKEAGLSRAIDDLAAGRENRLAYSIDPDSFQQVPGSPFAYWVGDGIRRVFASLSSFESDGRHARKGLSTDDDFRFVRCHWECRQDALRSNSWPPFVKGGNRSHFYADIHTVLEWSNAGESLKSYTIGRYGNAGKRVFNEAFYFQPGLTWPLRGIRFSAAPVPSGCVFSGGGKMAFARRSELLAILAIFNSMVFDALICLFAGKVGGVQYESGLIGKVPFPEPDTRLYPALHSHAQRAWSVRRLIDAVRETSNAFTRVALLSTHGTTLVERAAAWTGRVQSSEEELANIQAAIDDIAFRLYGIDGEDRRAIEAGTGTRPTADGDVEVDEDEEPDAETATDARSLVVALVSYAVGAVFGRWDLRYATGERTPPDLPDPFAPLPVCSPGMLQGPDGLPPALPPEDYPLRIDADGLLVDDPDHPDDILRRVRDVLEVIWKERAEAIEREACEILGVADLRDYFRKPGAGGFWDDHIKRYSKSRRKAPIYWLLQSSKKNYALWLYYHRLDKDILFKALLNYVEPKIRKEDARLGELRSQKAALGPAAKGAKKIDKDIDRQEAFLSELRDFEDKLRRAANLHLDPDLNDGVVLNIAPLHELVPWKEAKNYWEELLEGKYEWSSIGKQMREKGLVKC
jgi:hypothetical protein